MILLFYIYITQVLQLKHDHKETQHFTVSSYTGCMSFN